MGEDSSLERTMERLTQKLNPNLLDGPTLREFVLDELETNHRAVTRAQLKSRTDIDKQRREQIARRVAKAAREKAEQEIDSLR